LALLILRMATGLSLVAVGNMLGNSGETATLILRGASLVVAVLLVIGLATPLAGVGDAAIQIGIMLVGRGFGSLSIVATALGLALAMLGPGAWSVDARVFGRKRIV
jgi:uncharacterized membrane protein YphA (DoxX/SURF4 family)